MGRMRRDSGRRRRADICHGTFFIVDDFSVDDGRLSSTIGRNHDRYGNADDKATEYDEVDSQSFDAGQALHDLI